MGILIWDMSAREWDAVRNHPYTFDRVRFRDNGVASRGTTFSIENYANSEQTNNYRRLRSTMNLRYETKRVASGMRGMEAKLYGSAEK